MRVVASFLYQWLIFTPILVFATIITAVLVMCGCTIGKHKFWGYVPPKYWSKIVCRAALCKIRVKPNAKVKPDESYVFVANHQGAFDIFLTYGYLNQNIKWVQKSELRRLPFVGKASEIAGHVFVDSSNTKTMLQTIQKAEEELVEGVSMVIFPEGARTLNAKMGRFRKGAYVIATQMQLPIVPITLNGPYNVLKRNTSTMHFGKTMEIIVHDPIETKGLTTDDIPELIEQSRSAIESGLWAEFR
ncbi:lysophospholipid acyltransferase family protein [Dysgonomonas macrotermitis]|uniref:1-acyl-sn-glycerol-3-phosphate acyltransferase n=1 Tax=Dysgonomonas macrotermitis TaxID=1346286 RepID=A0A1M4TQ69_9BACT|nr:lysophospholipid acyltransferase family protein [Dysgonomonas macrotermitis]SHE46534.1 1-acyl-sn-glycerol-3-phosphate acyltransferase [Dysgonomonas macrotermitis]